MEEKEILSLKSKANLNCSLCEKCCEYRGDIKITPINVLQISKYLKISIQEFIEKFTHEVEGEAPEIAINGVGSKRECIFNDRGNFKCKIHKVKPMQCVVFPLVPVDVKNDLFIHSHACPVDTNKWITVDKWVNGNHHIYSKNKTVYMKWIEFIEEIQPKWKSIAKEKQEEMKKILYDEYDCKKDNTKQVLENIKRAREIFYQ